MKRFTNCGLGVTACCLFTTIFLSGCLIRTYTVVKDRADQDVSGNQGYLLGSAPEGSPQPKKFTKRKTKVLEIEFGSPIKVEKLVEPPKPVSEKEEDVSLDGNRGFLKGEPLPEPQEESAQEIHVLPQISTSVISESSQTALPVTYVVQKDDTLQKISARPEIYGTVKKWIKIYKANKDKLKAPDKIRPGQELKIPRD